MLQIPANTGIFGTLTALLGASGSTTQPSLPTSGGKQVLPGGADFAALMRDLLSDSPPASVGLGTGFSASEKLRETLSGLLDSQVEIKSVRKVAEWAVVETELVEETDEAIGPLFLLLPLDQVTPSTQPRTNEQGARVPFALLIDPRTASEGTSLSGQVFEPIAQESVYEKSSFGPMGEKLNVILGANVGAQEIGTVLLAGLAEKPQTATHGIFLAFQADGVEILGTTPKVSEANSGVSPVGTPAEVFSQLQAALHLTVHEGESHPANVSLPDSVSMKTSPAAETPLLQPVSGEHLSEKTGLHTSTFPQVEETSGKPVEHSKVSSPEVAVTSRPAILAEGAGQPLPLEVLEPFSVSPNAETSARMEAVVMESSKLPAEKGFSALAISDSAQRNGIPEKVLVPLALHEAQSKEVIGTGSEPLRMGERPAIAAEGLFPSVELKIPAEVAAILRQAFQGGSPTGLQLATGTSPKTNKASGAETKNGVPPKMTSPSPVLFTQMDAKEPAEGLPLKNVGTQKPTSNTVTPGLPESAALAFRPTVQVLLGEVAAQIRDLAGQIIRVRTSGAQAGQAIPSEPTGGTSVQPVFSGDPQSPISRILTALGANETKDVAHQAEDSSPARIAKSSPQIVPETSQPAKGENPAPTKEGTATGIATKTAAEALPTGKPIQSETKPGAEGFAKAIAGLGSLFDNDGTHESPAMVSRQKAAGQVVVESPNPSQSAPAQSAEEVRELGTKKASLEVIGRNTSDLGRDSRIVAPRSDTSLKQTSPRADISSVTDTTNGTSNTARTTSAQGTDSAPRPLEMQVVEQVTRAVRVQQTSQGTEIRIRLVPENLGEVHVKISMEKGVLTAEFRASTEATREILAKQAQQIQTVLEGSGMQAERVVVKTANAGLEDRGGNPFSQRESTSQQNKEQGPGHDQRGRGQQSPSGDDREGKDRSPWDRWERFA